MLSWRSGRGLQWQPVVNSVPKRVKAVLENIGGHTKYWPFGPNLDILKISLRGVLMFVASGLDINGCVLSYFEGTANLDCYSSCTLTTLHCSKVSFLQCCHMKISNKIFTQISGVYSFLWDTVNVITGYTVNVIWVCFEMFTCESKPNQGENALQ